VPTNIEYRTPPNATPVTTKECPLVGSFHIYSNPLAINIQDIKFKHNNPINMAVNVHAEEKPSIFLCSLYSNIISSLRQTSVVTLDQPVHPVNFFYKISCFKITALDSPGLLVITPKLVAAPSPK